MEFLLSSLLLGCWIELSPCRDGLGASLPVKGQLPCVYFYISFEDIFIFKTLPPHSLQRFFTITYSVFPRFSFLSEQTWLVSFLRKGPAGGP